MKEGSGAGAVLGILTALGSAVAVAAIAKSASASSALPTSPAAPSSPSTTPCNAQPLAAQQSWQTVTTVNPGDHIRISMEPSVFETVTQSQGLASSGLAPWIALLSSSAVQTALGTSAICAWAPGQALPTDWPSSDPDVASEYHADLVYGGTSAIAVADFPLPVSVWAARPAWGPQGPGGSGTVAGGTTPAQASGSIFKVGNNANVQTTSTAPQTVTLAAPGGPLSVPSAAVGTPITIVLSGGGTFKSVDAYATGPNAAEVPTPGFSPMSPVPPLPWFTFTTPATTGTIAIGWQDSQGNAYASTITYGS